MKTGLLKTILTVYAVIFSESLVNKVSLLDEVGIGMTNIGRNFWFPQPWMVDWGGGEGGYSGCNFRAPGKGARTWFWSGERSNSWGLCICLTWRNCLIMCDISASVWSLLHLQRLVCLEGNYSFCGLPNLVGKEKEEKVYWVTMLNKYL